MRCGPIGVTDHAQQVVQSHGVLQNLSRHHCRHAEQPVIISFFRHEGNPKMPTDKLGTVDGQPAIIRYDADQRKSHVFWGGIDGPLGIGHNHATVLDSSPDEFHFLRVGKDLVVHQGYNPKKDGHRRQRAGHDIAGIFGESLRKAIDFNMRNLRGGR